MSSGAKPFEHVALEKIASGGTATVFLGARNGRGGPVALKRPHPHVVEDPGLREALLREARLAASLASPHVVAVREVEEGSEGLQLVMDYVEGATLGELVARQAKHEGRVPPAIALRIVLDACLGLSALHDHRDARGVLLGLIHRDVSPQNILVGVDGLARLTDFGLAKGTHEGGPSTTRGALKGKLGYMAPEYVKGGRPGRAVDVFAMGVVAWEALAGKRLFRGENEAETLERLLRERAPALSEVDRALAGLDAPVARALAKDPADRFPTVSAFAASLGDAAGAGGVADHAEVSRYVREVSGSDLAQRRARFEQAVRSRVTAAESSASRRGALAVVATFGVVFGVGLFTVAPRATSARDPAIESGVAPPPPIPPPPAESSPEVELPSSPDGSEVPARPPVPSRAAGGARPRPSATHAPPPNPYGRQPPAR